MRWGQVAEHFLLQLCESNPGDQGLRLRLSPPAPAPVFSRILSRKTFPRARAQRQLRRERRRRTPAGRVNVSRRQTGRESDRTWHRCPPATYNHLNLL